MTVTDSNHDPGDPAAPVVVFRGSRAGSFEFGLVLEAKGLSYERLDTGDVWVLNVAPALAEAANDELRRYAAERVDRPEMAPPFVPFNGSAWGALLYSSVLMATAYCAGVQWFDVDWMAAGALDAGAADQWWRAVTALTLHLDQEHLLGNLLFGAGIGVLAGRMFGPGVAWLGILVAGAAANALDMWVSPTAHRAVGASTAVFAALGLLAGFGWRQRLPMRNRRWYRWAPLIAGLCLLALLGSGNEHVDVLGHLLGFVAGVALGWLFARARLPRNRGSLLQFVAGGAAMSLIVTAWLLALRAAR